MEQRFEAIERRAGGVPEADVQDRPQHRSGDVPREEGATAHARRAGEQRDARPHDGDEPSEEDRLGPASLEVLRAGDEPLLTDELTEPGPPQPRLGVTAELVADRVARG